ncbi:epsilon dna polymerase [Phaffia rhodozyma]|uniref:DNA polymerase epsilon subunit B n=1 Tax=Phaffia rhodozyma TaxID=264483 RepID=A0A0F7SP66_PHARH|nr:epsilon dna polymerase [Phaffia rhodozyma]
MQSTIFKIFTTKHSLTLPSQVLGFVEKILIEHEVERDMWADSCDHLAREYMRGEDPSPLVTLKGIEQAYQALQLKTDINEENDPLAESTDEVNVENHFKVIDSYKMPGLRFDSNRGVWSVAPHKPSIAAPPLSKASFLRERCALIRQIVLRSEHFTPPVLGGRDKDEYMKLNSIKNLLGRPNQRFLLLGILGRTIEGELCLEDGDGKVTLDMDEATPGEGLFTEGCVVLVEGEYTDEERMRVIEMGHPPSEKRAVARSLYGHVDFLGVGATSQKDEDRFAPLIAANSHISFVIVSDLWLDHPKTFSNLRRMFEVYAGSTFRPLAFIFCGNFSSSSCIVGGASGLAKYTENFNQLANLLSSFPDLAQTSHFIFVPGPLDPWGSTTLPRPPIPDTFVARVKARLPKAQFMSNPCRIKYFDQEIVICREDLMGRMLRNLEGVKEGVKEGADMKKYLVQTILDQCHLSPLPLSVRPTLWDFDHALRLYPMPTSLILADKYERYELTYEGCHVFNPGSFIGNSFEWSTYYPSTQRSERSDRQYCCNPKDLEFIDDVTKKIIQPFPRPIITKLFNSSPPLKMPSYDDVEVITAYEANLPTKAFEQDGAGLDSEMPVLAEHTKLEAWDENGKPYLKEYEGAGKLKGKIALLTGADSGIGRSAAIMLAREGASISIVALSEEKKDAEEVKAMIEGSKYSPQSKVNIIYADLSKKGDGEAKRILEEHTAVYGQRLDVLVNNAAQQVTQKDLTKIDMDVVERTFQINIIAMFAITKAALPLMKRGSAIINTTSVTAYKGSGGFMDYAATKGAIVAFTRSLSVQLSPKGIRANAVAPGPIYTPLQPAARPGDEIDGFGAGAVPLHSRAGQPAECGPTYVYLASADANYVTGQVLHVNGGMLCPS